VVRIASPAPPAIRAADPATELLIDGTGSANPLRWVYLDGGASHDTVIELIERTAAAKAAFGATLKLLT
jgi:hypothetical protein